MKNKVFILFLMIFTLTTTVNAAVSPPANKPKKPMSIKWQDWKVKPSKKNTAFPALVPSKQVDPNLKGQINEVLFLPPEMYGTWSIRAVVVQSDAPINEFQPVSQEIWTLERSGNNVTIENVVTNAKASVHVDKVQDNIATFHHDSTASDGSMSISETPTVAVRKDALIGSNDQVYVFYRGGREVNRYHLKVNVTGTRLAKQTRQIAPEVKPNFEILPMQTDSSE